MTKTIERFSATLILFLFFFGGICSGNDAKTIFAVKTDFIRIDGILDEKIWQNEGTSAFIQTDPLDGETPTEKTTVWVAYDKNAIYIGARLFDSRPDQIIGRLGRRDELVDSDWFILALDPYLDRHSGYQFGVNPDGSIIDMTLYNDERRDLTWDGVWDSAVKIDTQGWTVEIKIPFHQLRFKKKKNIFGGSTFRESSRGKTRRLSMLGGRKKTAGMFHDLHNFSA